ncbi:MAG: FHA domain-containing protein [Candidatus Symbiothrix sp.]|jgi:hypothetical protein|nr:FHA domain-containing protein [Candidatus Symbiothrix sp.]
MKVITIGRGHQNNIVIDESDKNVSREHLDIVKDDNKRYKLIDHSRNGTYVNGRNIKDKAIYLIAGDEVKVGNAKLPWLSYFKPETNEPPVRMFDSVLLESIVEKLAKGCFTWTETELQFQQNYAKELEDALELYRRNNPPVTPVLE